MNNPPQIRRLGTALIILAALGMLFCLTGIVVTWVIKPKVQAGLQDITGILQTSLTTTDTGIIVLQGSIDDAKTNLNTLQDSLNELGTTLEDISVSLETTAALIGDEIRLTVINTQVAISSAATSAEIIDDTLAFIASIPILGADYQADIPLHISLQQIADDLDDVPATLEVLEANLNDTASGLNAFSEDLTQLSEDLDGFTSGLGQIQETLDDYSILVQEALLKVSIFQTKLPGYLLLCCIFLSGMLLWLGVAQVNLLFQGLALRNNELKVVNLADLTRE